MGRPGRAPRRQGALLGLGALALRLQGDARRLALAVVGVGRAVATANRLEKVVADLRLDRALAGRLAGAGLVLAELLVRAVRVGLARGVTAAAGGAAASALVIFLGAGLHELALVVVGLAVATTDGGVFLRAVRGLLHTDARQVGDVALADGILAEQLVRALQARDTAALGGSRLHLRGGRHLLGLGRRGRLRIPRSRNEQEQSEARTYADQRSTDHGSTPCICAARISAARLMAYLSAIRSPGAITA